MKTKLFLPVALFSISAGLFTTSCSSSENNTTEQSQTDSSAFTVQEGETGGYLLVGYNHKGAYQNITTVIDKIRQSIGDSSKVIAVYFDDEEKVAEADLKSFAGYIVNDSAEANKIIGANKELSIVAVAKKNSFYADQQITDWKNVIEIAPKVYNALSTKINEKNAADKKTAIEEHSKGSTRFILQLN